MNIKAQQVEPPFWWVGMNNDVVQIMIHHDGIANLQMKSSSDDVEILKVHKVDNENYVFVDLKIKSTAKAGIIKFDFYKGKKRRPVYTFDYELKQRREGSAQRKGFGQEDVMYLLMPDRFANGDANNDNVKGYPEQADRSNPDGRHGGDLKGIENNLDYLQDLGISAIWLNPVMENNMPAVSYHGYAITDFYKVDARFGSNSDYLKMVQTANSKKIKIVMDMVFNHCASEHYWMNDMPDSSWIHNFPEFTRSNYRGGTLMDPHASNYDKKIMSHGWFDKTMPDLDQTNPYLAKYLIQNSIWWVEYADLGGIRMDTYPYADHDFMNEWVAAVYNEYPNFNIVGEAWLQTVANTAYFQNNTFADKKAVSKLNTVTDFPLCYAMNSAFNEQDSWTDGVASLYMTLAQDFVYSNADSNLIFLENHDIDRFASNINGDFDKWKMGMTFLMTTRGIPMIYYGGEFMTEGRGQKSHGYMRTDFPGGWEGDSVNVFTGTNMSEKQVKSLAFSKYLLKLRNEHTALQTGKLTHYIPKDSYYIYFRSNAEESFMIVLNNSDKEYSLSLHDFAESLDGYSRIKNASDDNISDIKDKVMLDAKSATIFQLFK
ncbi:MAG: alpha-amlyase [Bacteroidetes bacterium 4572_112]|nr:MAG: alpha-amlyase [Bacteroidetes bacterium 4572_112]